MIYDKIYDNLENCPFCGSKEFLLYSLDVYDKESLIKIWNNRENN